jgi:predicted RNA-binding protein with PUA-like domain
MMPNHWLLKTEPGTYAYADLERQGEAVWDGVTNALALKHLRSMKKGDLAFVYHTGDEKQIVGIARVASDPYPDPKQKDERLVVVKVKARELLKRPVTLTEIKARKEFAHFDLVRMARLSVMPVIREHWDQILRLADNVSDR